MKKKRGKLIPIGGGEDKRDSMKVLKTFLNQVNTSRHPRIEIITIATSLPREVARDYEDAFKDLNFKNYNFIHIEDSREADRGEYLDRLERADGIFFSGGDQLRLCAVIGGTEFLDIIKYRYENEGLVIAGTSAGATAMPVFMIARGSSEAGLLKGEIKLTSGLGFLDNAIIDTHFTERGRFSRLMNIVGTNPRLVGLGFGEDTAALIQDDTIEVIGSGLVVIIDGSEIGYSNITSVKEGDPVTIEGLVVHLLAEGEKFDLRKRRMLIRRSRRPGKRTAKKVDRKSDVDTSRTKKTVKHGTRR